MLSAAQEKRFQEMQASLVAEHDLGELGDMGRASQDKVVVIGRVCCEAEGKLNSMSRLKTNRLCFGRNIDI